jgi:hypothetical protein
MDEFGQIIFMTSEEGDFEKGIKASMRQIISANGIPLNNITESIIDKLAREEAEKIKRRTKRGGIPSSLRILLSLKEKKKAVSWIKKMTISTQYISNLILNCKKLGYIHRKKHKEFIPEDKKQRIEEMQINFVTKTGEAILYDEEKIIRQLAARYLNRKYSTAHLFEKGNEWHLFYFDHNDMYIPTGVNHHSKGPHIHYISHLWGKHNDKETLWGQFENRDIKINSEHIRFIEEKIVEQSKNNGKVKLARIKPQSVMKIDDKIICLKNNSSFKIYRKSD